MPKIDIEKTKKYYEVHKPCDCYYCKNYISKIKEAYPLICKYLESIGIDPLKPFELLAFDFEDRIEYICQYVVFGECNKKDGEIITSINDINICINNTNHPNTDILDKHFVIDFGPIYLAYN